MSVNKLTQARAAVGSLLVGSTSGKKNPTSVSPIEVAGIYQVSATVNPGTIATQTTFQTTVTITGAQAGDAVVAIPPAALEAGFTVGGSVVTAANTVQVTLNNNTAAGITGASRTWQFLLIKLAPNN